MVVDIVVVDVVVLVVVAVVVFSLWQIGDAVCCIQISSVHLYSDRGFITPQSRAISPSLGDPGNIGNVFKMWKIKTVNGIFVLPGAQSLY